MNNKKIKLLSGIALGFIALSLLYTLCLLLTGTYGDSIIKQPSTGDTSQDLGASIGYACTTGIHLVTVTFAAFSVRQFSPTYKVKSPASTTKVPSSK